MLKLFRQKNFSIFWFGETISIIGDQISLIAFPWLVLQMTGSAALTGLVFAVQGIPRAFLMLAGGALVDRTSPRFVMLSSNLIRMILVLSLAYLISNDAVGIPTVFLMAFAFGVADAFFYPASTSMLPSLVSRSELQSGNAIIQMTLHLGMTVGPVLAAIIIAGEISSVTQQDTASEGISSNFDADKQGLSRAFYVDAMTFALSFLSLLFVKARPLEESIEDKSSGSIYKEIKNAARWVISIPAVKLGFVGMAVIHFFFMPMIFVGIPVWAKQNFIEGAYVFGMVTAAYGMGAFIGAISAGYLKGPDDKNLIPYMFWAFVFSGSTLALTVFYNAYWWAMLLFFIAGGFDTFFYVHFTTWLQRITPENILGRVMSILMLMSMGLLPVADGIMGFAIEISLNMTMVASAIFLMVFCSLVALNPRARLTTQAH